jgi:heparan-alpha-glucosaminide N-acetyltransferase
MTNLKPYLIRIASIDIFRALTMLLMIFVNDLWSLSNIPGWLEHTEADFDGMGLADVVFPAFLFIVGLSIPYAIRNRLRKGDSTGKIALHIFFRSFALIVMGFFHVNFENINPELLPVALPVYEIIMTIAFFLIWNVYPEDAKIGKVSTKWFQLIGVIILIILAVIYRGGNVANPVWMQPYWWGILGLIGWSYLVSALIYLITRNKFWLFVVALLFFSYLNFQEFSPLFDQLPKIRLIISASNYSLVLCGVFASAIYLKLAGKQNTEWKYLGLLLFLAIVFIGYGFEVRPLGGISKIKATPSWTAICAGISFAVYAFLFFLADKYKLTKWAGIIAPAGRSTLTCYLVPYLVYPVMSIVNWKWPEIMTSGYTGLLKSLIFALVIIWITGLLEKIHIRLKI